MRTHVRLPFQIFAIFFSILCAAATSATDYVRDVQPILQKHCYACHGEEKQSSGLRLDIRSEALQGGELYGAGIVPGKPDESPLIQFIRGGDADLEMPPDGQRLSAEEVATLSRWVDEGAVWPDGVDEATLEDRRDHWSFKPIRDDVAAPPLNSDWPRNEIDRFILARLEQEGLRPAPEAERATWLRRVSFDLTGLPPSPEQVEDFVNDSRLDAYERVVDRLLRSPRYGERWAQHWLDVVRYADTHGFEVNTERPTAWPYRDYVIEAFNHDTPYDRFVREQIVGDAMGRDAATGFLVTASVLLPGQIGQDAPSKRLARQDALDEIVVNITQTFLGLSVGCARCHDHKFDPISQRDYYSMQAFVAGVEYADRELRTPQSEAMRREAESWQMRVAEIEHQLARYVPLAQVGAQPDAPRRQAVNARMNVDRITPVPAKRVRFTIRATQNLEPCLDELEIFDTSGSNVALASRGATATSSGDTTVVDRHELKFLNDGQYGNSRSWMSNEHGKGWVILELPEETTIERIVWGRDREGKFSDRLAIDYSIEVAATSGAWRTVADASDRTEFAAGASEPGLLSTAGLSAEEAQHARELLREKTELDALIAKASAAQLVFAGTFRTPDEIRLLRRGDPEQPQDEVVPAILETLGSLELSNECSEQERRETLAHWIASPDNPLTARVMANRIWQGHFGIGLVATSNDFGRNGAEPSHPELLDWLASEFIRSNWSIKQLHRQIVLSSTYRQSSRHDEMAAAKDADVRLLWRYPSRRLEGEAIRDSMLTVSGELNTEMGGSGFDLFDKRGGLTGFEPVESFPAAGLRRMIYAHKVRRERDAVFGAFDCPDAGQSTPRRSESTTPIQALNLFNSRFVLERADALAARVESEVGDDRLRQIRLAYRFSLGREPSAGEIADAEPYVSEYGLATLCRALFNSNEFLFLP